MLHLCMWLRLIAQVTQKVNSFQKAQGKHRLPGPSRLWCWKLCLFHPMAQKTRHCSCWGWQTGML